MLLLNLQAICVFLLMCMTRFAKISLIYMKIMNFCVCMQLAITVGHGLSFAIYILC